MDRAAPEAVNFEGQPASPEAIPSSEGARRTLVVRNGDKVLISVPVGRDSALAIPLKIHLLPNAGARLIVRVASEVAPCSACIEDHLLSACAADGLGAGGIFAAIREGIAHCVELQRHDPLHGIEQDVELLPSRTRALLLAPANEPHVVTGGGRPESSEMDLILIL
ncbi:hypothetical protein [Chondromyces crocatus]|nr:hypothetical protein [Chondromyces crocatus]